MSIKPYISYFILAAMILVIGFSTIAMADTEDNTEVSLERQLNVNDNKQNIKELPERFVNCMEEEMREFDATLGEATDACNQAFETDEFQTEAFAGCITFGSCIACCWSGAGTGCNLCCGGDCSVY